MRVDELDFRHPAALYRGDGSGVAVIRRTTAVGTGPAWAEVVQPGAGLDSRYLFLEYHSGDVQVHTVSGDAAADLPAEPHRDPRLTAVGAWFEESDPDTATVADVAAAEKLHSSRAAIKAASFVVDAELEGRRWSATVGPTAFGTTSLVLRGEDGLRQLDTAAPRPDLERARTEAVQIEATEMVDRGRFDFRTGRKTRAVQLTLRPASAEATA
jgi:hypothetical protein